MLHLRPRHPVYPSVFPAQAGIQAMCVRRDEELDPRLRGDDGVIEAGMTEKSSRKS